MHYVYFRKYSNQSLTLEPPPAEHENEVEPISTIAIKNFNPALETKILIHGWMASGSSSFAVDTKTAYLESRDCNVIVVDWGPLSNNVFYPIPMQETRVSLSTV